MKTYLVGVFYKTPNGNVGAKNFTIKAKNEDAAMEEGRKRIKKRGKGYKIQGGDCVLKK